MDIVILAHSRFGDKYSSTIRSLAKVFAREHRVFYIEKPYTVKDVIKGFRSKQMRKRLPALLFGKKSCYYPQATQPNLVAITPRMIWSINWLPKGRLFRALAHMNDLRIYQSMDDTFRLLLLNDFVFINSFMPLYGNYFPERFQPRRFIYHSVDEISESPYVARHGSYLEEKMAKRADCIVTTSKELLSLRSRQNEQVYMVPNAADVGLFQRALYEDIPPPVVLNQIPFHHKVIVYIGNICHRLDYPLLRAISEMDDCTLLMVGPLSTDVYKRHGLDRKENVIFTGPKPLHVLPSFLKYAHCGIIPFLCNKVTKSIYPLKVNEYLAAGIPVVSTPFSEDIRDFEGTIHIAGSSEAFIEAIQTVVRTDSPVKKKMRVAVSSRNSWEARAERFLEILNESNEWKPNRLHPKREPILS